MNKLTIKKIVEFRNKKTDKTKKFFATKLKIDLKKANEEKGGGGHYWISTISALRNVFKTNEIKFIRQKIEQLQGKIALSDKNGRIINYQRNIDVLNTQEDFDLKNVKPEGEIELLHQNSEDYLLNIQGFEVEAKPHYVFSFNNKGTKEVGAIWFIAQQGGFSEADLGMYADIMYQYLQVHFSTDYVISSRYCVAVDIHNNSQINYAQIEKGEIETVLEPTLIEIKELM